MSRWKQTLGLAIAALTVAGIVVLGPGVKESVSPGSVDTWPVMAQVPTRRDIGRQVYEQLPFLPLENQYVSKETGKVVPNNTLAIRLIRYHTYVKGRPAIYRLDWKLTLADYLDANELMQESNYPGVDTLRSNPIEGDRAAVGRLSRAQRDALVQVLVDIFNPNASATQPPATSAAPQPSATPSTGTSPILPLPRPGDAQLLKL